ncbi:hypothetical protein QRO11_16380 [Paracidovorax citrulli]|uniref:Uncharacterized protein n=2 Tax=Paracidovorax citrulli TaxID=80869 RepID=A1TM67_PARC0|nr:hypothetical protein [Paracidovorax citrulli]ABM32055.1 hypothetical protein Aave_1464 [Paracidovorax citrulli AAC00-1]ATG94915.1 hypothetical protein CQB05_13455 [Paracidovorax citrulli]MVT38410.1 hypothetical protein [Paracidovorax citrulli]PVY66244.1 hypothetical protein C8E08_3643 [Paracidovorax citrulli]QCX11983.1 hypothetical protein APS58_3208 [Paracidovorax citrulli]
MKRWIVLAAAALAAGTLQAAGAPAPTVRVANPELLAALQNPEAALQAARTPLAFDNGESARNCREYAELLPKSRPVESERNFEIRGEYLLCDALHLVAGKPFAAEKAGVAARRARTLHDRLDVRTFPSSLRNRADAKRHTVKTVLPGASHAQGAVVAVETPDQRFRLEVVATVAPGKGRKPEWIVWVSDESKTGTYRGYSTLVVQPPRNKSGAYTAADASRP